MARLATKINGGIFSLGKASNGSTELVSGDIMDGGAGIDELRITATGTSITPIEDTVKLTPSNFVNIEKVALATNAARDTAQYPAVQDQMAAGALPAITTGIDAINMSTVRH